MQQHEDKLMITETALELWGYSTMKFGQNTSEAESHLVQI